MSMKMKRLILTADTRGSDIIQYRKVLGYKLFLKKIVAYDDDNDGKQITIFIKRVRLLDLITKTYEKELVFLRVKTDHKKFVEVEVI